MDVNKDVLALRLSYVGNRPLNWWPNGSEAVVSTEDAALSVVLEERQLKLVRYIEDKLERVGANDIISSAEDTSNIRWLWESFIIVSDPTMARRLLLPRNGHGAGLDDRASNEWLAERLPFLQGFVYEVLSPFTESGGGLRPSADKAAQSTVCKWYGNRCVLTGTTRTEGAHIVPGRATQSDRL